MAKQGGEELDKGMQESLDKQKKKDDEKKQSSLMKFLGFGTAKKAAEDISKHKRDLEDAMKE
jgi:hypothetical protein